MLLMKFGNKMTKLFKKLPLNQNFKAILNYCFRVLIFLLFCRHTIYDFVSNIFYPMLANFVDSLNLDPFVDVGIFAIFSVLVHDYLYAKICGLFKKLDNLNIFLSMIIVVLTDIIRGYSWGVTIQLTPLKLSYGGPNFIFILIFSFILYKFLNFLTKIFPVPFKQIGYIFSIELWKDIYRDVKKDIEGNYLKKKC